MKTMLLLITAAMAAAGCQSSGGGVTLNNTVTACGSGDCSGSNNSANNNTTNQGQGITAADAGVKEQPKPPVFERTLQEVVANLPDGYYKSLDLFIVSESDLGDFEYEDYTEVGRHLHTWVQYIALLSGNQIYQVSDDPPTYVGNWKPQILVRKPNNELRKGAKDPFLRLISNENGEIKIGGQTTIHDIVNTKIHGLSPPPPDVGDDGTSISSPVQSRYCREFANKRGYWCQLGGDGFARCMEVDTDMDDWVFYESYDTRACAMRGTQRGCIYEGCDVEPIHPTGVITVMSNYYNRNYPQPNGPFHWLQNEWACAGCELETDCADAAWWTIFIGIQNGADSELKIPVMPNTGELVEPGGIVGAALLKTFDQKIEAQVWEDDDVPYDCSWKAPRPER